MRRGRGKDKRKRKARGPNLGPDVYQDRVGTLEARRGLRIRVYVIASKWCYGHLRFNIAPVGMVTEGPSWVDAGTVELDEVNV